MVSCESAPKEEPTESDETSMEDVREEASNLLEVSKEYTAEEMERLKAELILFEEELKNKTREVDDQFNNLSKEAQSKLNEQKNQLDERRKELDAKLAEWNDAADEKKEELKSDAEQLKSALDKSMETFKKEMEDEK
jgi:hypothetical protein